MKLLKNREVQLSICVIFVLLVILGAILIGVCNNFANELNTIQLKQNIATLGTITKQYPQLESEIIKNYTKGYEENYEYSKSILEKYSYNEEININKNSAIQNEVKKVHLTIYIAIALFALILIIFLVLCYSLLFKKIRRLSVNAESVIEGQYNSVDGDINEGDIGHLTYQINTMSERLSESMQALKNDKLFLKRLITDISHQLKTPLASLIMFNDILENDKTMPEQDRSRFLLESKKQLDRMEWLIKNMMKMAKLEAGIVEYDKKNALVSDTVKRSIAALELIATEKNVNISVSGDDNIRVKHDINWTTEALSNIIKNSIEHSKNSSKINISWDENNVFTQIIIKDNGSGISKEELPKIFDRFYKGTNSCSPTNIGIGLYISKTIIDGQGGAIYAYSKEGQGAKFIIRFMKV